METKLRGIGLLSIKWICAVALMISAGPALAQGNPSNTAASPLSLVVTRFEANGVILLDAILQLAQQEQVPIGIEVVDAPMLSTVINRSFVKQKFGIVLGSLLAAGGKYQVSVKSGTILVSATWMPLGTQNLFDILIPDYELQRPATLQEAGLLLYMTLDSQINGPTGFAGSYNPGDVRHVIGPLSIRDAKVREILCRIVSMRQYAAWVAKAPPNRLLEIPKGGLWDLLEYSNEPITIAAYLRNLPQFAQ